MSRLGKKPVSVPSGVDVAVEGRNIKISKGSNTLTYQHRPEVGVAWDEGSRTLSVTIDPGKAEQKFARAMWGTTRALLENMVIGVDKGYEKVLEVVGVGYNASVSGQNLNLKVGYANTVTKKIPDGLSVTVEQQNIRIKGTDKQKVGQFAAEVRAVRKPEPYNGKGIKYSDEVIVRKQGKAFGS